MGSKCVVPYCNHVRNRDEGCQPYARFPKDLERCRIWIRAVGVEDLVHLPHEKLNTIRFVCACHFNNCQFTSATRKRLKHTAIPTLFDPRVIPLDDAAMEEFLVNHPHSVPSHNTTITDHGENSSISCDSVASTSKTQYHPSDNQESYEKNVSPPSANVDNDKVDTNDKTVNSCEPNEASTSDIRYRPPDKMDHALRNAGNVYTDALRDNQHKQNSNKKRSIDNVEDPGANVLTTKKYDTRNMCERDWKGSPPDRMEYDRFGIVVSRKLKSATSDKAYKMMSKIFDIITE